MSQFPGRPLNDQKSVEDFLQFALDFIDFVDFENLVPDIVNSELGVVGVAEKTPTLSSSLNRTFKYRDDIRRWKLRKKIVDELSSIKRLAKDDDLELGKGGALPLTDVKSEKQAFIIVGPPASGKSGISEKLADMHGAVIIDSDYAKRKLPEYRQFTYGSSLVHDESSAIIRGFAKDPGKCQSLYEICVDKEYNFVIPTVGSNYSSILSLASTLKDENGYKVHLILVALSKRKATIRAALRFYETKRYVPLSLIFDIWGNDPWLTYFYLRDKHSKVFKSFGAVSTDVPKNSESIRFDMQGESPVSIFTQKDVKIEW